MEPSTGKTIPGETVRRHLELPAGVYLRLLIRQRGLDLVAVARGPSGDVVARSDGPAGTRVPEQLWWITEEDGGFVLELTAAPSPETTDAEGSFTVEVELCRSAVPEDVHGVTASGLYLEAAHRLAMDGEGERRKALDLFRRTLPLWRRAGDDAERARTWNQIGMILHRDDLDGALEAYGEALPLFRRVKEQAGEASTLINLGRAQRKAGRLEEAVVTLGQAVALVRELEDLGRLSTLLNSLSLVERDLGNLERACGLASESLAAARTAENVARQALALNTRGECRLERGDGGGAEEDLKAALDLASSLGDGPGARRLAAAALGNLGPVLRRRGDIEGALAVYHRALTLTRRSGDGLAISHVLRNLGSAQAELGRLDESLAAYREARDLLLAADEGVAAADAARQIGWIEISLGRPEVARKTFAAAAADLRGSGPASLRAGLATARGQALLRLGDPGASIDALGDALGQWRSISDQNQVAQTLAYLGEAHRASGDLDQALDFLTSALGSARQVGDGPMVGFCLHQLARVHRDRGELEAARDLLEQSKAAVEDRRRRVPGPELRATFLARQREVYEDLVDVLLRLSRRGAPELEEQAFEVSARARARGLQDWLNERSQQTRRGLDPGLEAREDELWRRTVALELVRAETSEVEALRELDRKLSDLERERQGLTVEIRLRHPRYAELRDPRPLALEQLVALLPEGTVFVEYLLAADGGSAAFVVDGAGLRAVPIAAKAGEVEALVSQALTGLRRPGRARWGAYRRAAFELHTLLVAPVLELVPEAEHLLVAPDRSLHLLPFEALLTGDPASTTGAPGDLPYLLRRVAVSYVASADVLGSLAAGPRWRRDAAEGPSFVALADPTGSEPPLPEARREAASASAVFPPGGALVLTGDGASERALKGDSRLASASILHLATHGELGRPQPRLRLAAGDGEDGVLYLHEVFGLDLRAGLVVLSGCETGLGEEVAGEGILGLSRALFYAGASSVVVSLWRVRDASTAELMAGLYRAMSKGEGAHRALRRSKLALIDGDTWAHPFHWAPFVLQGDP
ncbi:MAG: CHAT domain-containing protein, partial [Acidobacteriota bacterium]